MASPAFGLELLPTEELKNYEFQTNGMWLPAVPLLHVGAQNYSEQINLRPTMAGLETIEGFSAIADTATDDPVSLHHFNKPGESHLIAKTKATGNVYKLYENITDIPDAGEFEATALYTVDDGTGWFANGPRGLMFYADDTHSLIFGGDELPAEMVLLSSSATAATSQDFSQPATNDITTDAFTVNAAGKKYIYVGSPYDLTGVKFYVASANASTSTIAGTYWNTDSWDALTTTDGTTSGGKALAQTGSVTWTAVTPTVRHLNGAVLRWYRFEISAGSATIYKVSVEAPFQTLKDVWNQSEMTCTALQAVRSGAYEDYTYQVESIDSATDAVYAASLGGLTSSDSVTVMFDDRAMGMNVAMYTAKCNAAIAEIAYLDYNTGEGWAHVNYFSDGTENDAGTSTLAKSGTIWWTPPAKNAEHPIELYGRKGYAYKLTFTGTLTDGSSHDGTSVDFIGGITAPLDMLGYEGVGVYNKRIMLVDGNRVDYSQTDYPWIFNGVDSSDNLRSSLYFGDENPIVATASLYNRYGSNLIETWVALKKTSSYSLSGVQSNPAYPEPFSIKTISDTKGCAAPKTVCSYVMPPDDVNPEMGAVVWLDYSSPVFFNGQTPSKIPGIENYFDQTQDECINYEAIDKSVAYIDHNHNQWNLIIPTGDSTVLNTWLVYDFKYKRWFEKDPAALTPVEWDVSGDDVLWDDSGDVVYWNTGLGTDNYPQAVASVIDDNGARYNYGHINDGTVKRLDHSQTWDTVPIYQRLVTGAFSPTVSDQFGFWTRSILRGIRLQCGTSEEDANTLINVFTDGDISPTYYYIPIDGEGIVAKNDRASYNIAETGSVFQAAFTTITSESKWYPLAWGFKARKVRND